MTLPFHCKSPPQRLRGRAAGFLRLYNKFKPVGFITLYTANSDPSAARQPDGQVAPSNIFRKRGLKHRKGQIRRKYA